MQGVAEHEHALPHCSVPRTLRFVFSRCARSRDVAKRSSDVHARSTFAFDPDGMLSIVGCRAHAHSSSGDLMCLRVGTVRFNCTETRVTRSTNYVSSYRHAVQSLATVCHGALHLAFTALLT